MRGRVPCKLDRKSHFSYGPTWISSQPFHISLPIWVDFGTYNPLVMLLSNYMFQEIKCKLNMTHPRLQGRNLKNDLRINECSYSNWQEDCRKIYGSIKEESWRIRTNKESEAILQEADIIKCIMLLRLRWYGHTETMDKEGMPKKMTARMEGTRKWGRPLEKWTDETISFTVLTSIYWLKRIWR